MSEKITRTGGGAFDPKDSFVYFLASNVDRQQWGAATHKYNLVAINELKEGDDLKVFEQWLDGGNKVFIDSGVYNLAMEHARAHNVHMDVALGMAPEKIDGFGKLFDKYVDLCRRYGDRAWGYIELDQGGRENKIRTRARLEASGLRPIPVYHPFNDGWDYFDYLAERYDRICFGNVVQADRYTRLRLIATAWERHRKYPDLWIHLLGFTPNEWLNAYPINSGDSSSWLSNIRWGGGLRERVCGKSIGDLPKHFTYVLGSDPDSEIGSRKAVNVSAYVSSLQQRNWRNYVNGLTGLGLEIYPKQEKNSNEL